MELWHAIILGIVEGITEYLPVSSTGHLIITSDLLGLDGPGTSEQDRLALDTFNIVIQGGAILAVLGLYWPRVRQMIAGVLGRDREGLRLAINIVIAFLPAAVLGVLLAETIRENLFSVGPVVAALALGGVWMIGLDQWSRRRAVAMTGDPNARPTDIGATIDSLTPVRALGIGLLQCIAMWPGTSRSMMTIGGGVMMGLRPRDAAEFSFLLGLPTLGGACVYSLWKNLREASAAGEPNMIETLGWGPVLVGLVVTTLTAIIAIRWLISFLTRHGLTVFGVYRLILSAVMLTLVWQDVVEFQRETIEAVSPIGEVGTERE